MKKSNFIDGAIISTLSLVLCKILGLVYVIPFYQIIGSEGGALYSYAYSIYAVFLNLSTIGIPAAIAKIISEYDALNYHYLKDKAYGIASKMLTYVGLISFLVMFIFSRMIAESIIGGVEGGNTVDSVSTAIKIVSLALLVVPRLSILKGYFQGNKYLNQTSLATIIEQLVRVTVIIAGSFLMVKVFHLPVNYAVYIAIFAATVGALVSFIYLKIKSIPLLKNDRKNLEITEEESKIDTKELIKKIVFYAIPFVIISLLQSAYNVVDTFTVVKTLTNIGYTTSIAETTIGVISTWGTKLNMIVVSMSIGITASLIPNVVGSYTVGDLKGVNDKLNLSFKMLIFITIPMTLGISFLAEPIWHIFYGVDALSISIFRIHILQVVVYGLFTTLITITQSMNQTRITLGALLSSFIIKLAINVPIMYALNKLGIDSYYGPTISDAISQFIAFVSILVVLKRKFKFNYKTLGPFLLKVIFSILIMLMVLCGLKYVYFNNISKFYAIITTCIYTIVGALVYFFVTSRFKLLDDILGKDYIKKILKRKGK